MIDRTAGWDTGERRLVEGTRRAARRRGELPDGGREQLRVDTEIPGGMARWVVFPLTETRSTKRTVGLAEKPYVHSRLFDVPGCLPADTNKAVSV